MSVKNREERGVGTIEGQMDGVVREGVTAPPNSSSWARDKDRGGARTEQHSSNCVCR